MGEENEHLGLAGNNIAISRLSPVAAPLN